MHNRFCEDIENEWCGRNVRDGAGVRWYAVHTKPAREEIAAETLKSLEMPVLLPRLKTTRRIRGKVRRVIKPLFPGYLFARFHPATQLHLVRYSRGVHDVICGGLIPIPIDDVVIEDVAARLDNDDAVEIKHTFRPGETVAIRSGPFQGLSGVFERELEGQGRVVILLEALHQARLLLEKECVETAAAA